MKAMWASPSCSAHVRWGERGAPVQFLIRIIQELRLYEECFFPLDDRARHLPPGSHPDEPAPNTAKNRLHWSSGMVDRAIQCLQHLNRFHPRIRAAQRPFMLTIHGILIGKVLNCVAQYLQSLASLGREAAANRRRPRGTKPHQFPGFLVCRIRRRKRRVLEQCACTKIKHVSPHRGGIGEMPGCLSKVAVGNQTKGQ